MMISQTTILSLGCAIAAVTAQGGAPHLPSEHPLAEDSWVSTYTAADFASTYRCGTGPYTKVQVINKASSDVKVDWCVGKQCTECSGPGPAPKGRGFTLFTSPLKTGQEFVVFAFKAGPHAGEDKELYADGKTHRWPASFTITDPKVASMAEAAQELAKALHSIDGNPAPPANIYLGAVTMDGITVLELAAAKGLFHFVHPTEPHCEDFTVKDLDAEWWVNNKYRYGKWATGLCSAKYNFVNEVDQPEAGITHRTLGVHTAPKSDAGEVSVFSVEDTAIKCGTGATPSKIMVSNSFRPSIKFRMCTKAVDPKTGWACNHGTPFVDCDRRVKMGESVELDISASVQTVLPVTFTEQGAIDMVSSCYMVKPAKGWAHIAVDQAWWDALQKSC